MHLDIAALRERLDAWSHKAASLPLFVCRVTLGWEFVVSGWLKIHKLGELREYFATLHIPWPSFNAPLVAWTELVCGALLLVGLASRLATIPLFISMTVALITAKRAEVHGLSDLFFQVEFTYLCMFLVVLVLGPGKPSIDAVIARAMDRRRGAKGARS